MRGGLPRRPRCDVQLRERHEVRFAQRMERVRMLERDDRGVRFADRDAQLPEEVLSSPGGWPDLGRFLERSRGTGLVSALD